MKCYKCDTELNENWNYCPNCKRKLRKNKIIEEEFVPTEEVGKCHTCSCVLDANWNFCPVCSAPVDFYQDSTNTMAIPIIATVVTDQKIVPQEQEVIVTEHVGVAPQEGINIEAKIVDKKIEHINTEVGKMAGYCKKCGTPLMEGHLFCAVCGTPVNEEINVAPVIEPKEVNPKELYAWLALTVLGVPIGLLLGGYVDTSFAFLGYALSLFSVIYAKSKYC